MYIAAHSIAINKLSYSYSSKIDSLLSLTGSGFANGPKNVSRHSES